MNTTTDSTRNDGIERIDVNSDEAMQRWERKLNVTAAQLKEAVTAVGDKAPDVEMHLKGTRASTNDDQIDKAGS
jgi:phosphoserine phosphatase